MFIKIGDAQPIMSIIDVPDVIAEDAKTKMKKMVDKVKKKAEGIENEGEGLILIPETESPEKLSDN